MSSLARWTLLLTTIMMLALVGCGGGDGTTIEETVDDGTGGGDTPTVPIGAPEAEVTGNGVVIENQDRLPDAADGTDFGSLAVGETLETTFVITNTGNASLTAAAGSLQLVGDTSFSLVGSTFDAGIILAPNETIDVVVQFAPLSAGTHITTVSFVSDADDSSVYEFTLRGVAVDPGIMVRGGELSVEIPSGSDTTQVSDGTYLGEHFSLTTGTFTIVSSGSSDLSLDESSPIELSGGEEGVFSLIEPTETVLAAGATESFAIVFNPEGASFGPHSVTVTVNSDATAFPAYTFVVTADAIERRLQVLGNEVEIANGDESPSNEDGTSFGVSYGETIAKTFTITHVGEQDLNIEGIGLLSRSVFALQEDFFETTLSAGDTLEFTVEFTPDAPGIFTDVVEIRSDDPVATPRYFFTLSGEGSSDPQIGVLGNGLSITNGDSEPTAEDGTYFGALDLLSGSVEERTFTVRNAGLVDLTLPNDAVTINGADNTASADFTVTQPTTQTLRPGETASFTVAYEPVLGGDRNGQVFVSSNDPDDSPYTFLIGGFANSPLIKIRPTDVPVAALEDQAVCEEYQIDNATDVVSEVANGPLYASLPIGSREERGFSIVNWGNADLELLDEFRVQILAVDFDDAASVDTGFQHFRLVTAPETVIGPNGSFSDFVIAFEPTSAGVKQAIVSIVSNVVGNDETYQFLVQGTAFEKPYQVWGSTVNDGVFVADNEVIFGSEETLEINGTDFGGVDLGAGGNDRFFRITTDAALGLEAPWITITGENSTEFTITAPADTSATSITAGGFQDFTIRFRALGAGLRQAQVNIFTNNADLIPVFSFDITGFGTGPQIQVVGSNSMVVEAGDFIASPDDGTEFPDLFAFDIDYPEDVDEEVPAQYVQQFTITNIGNETLDLDGSRQVIMDEAPSYGGSFFVLLQLTILDPPPPRQLNPGESMNFWVVFNPYISSVDALPRRDVYDPDRRTGVVAIETNDPQTPVHTFLVQGRSLSSHMDIRGNGLLVNDENVTVDVAGLDAVDKPLADDDPAMRQIDYTHYGVVDHGETATDGSHEGSRKTYEFFIENAGSNTLYLGEPRLDNEEIIEEKQVVAQNYVLDPLTEEIIGTTFLVLERNLGDAVFLTRLREDDSIGSDEDVFDDILTANEETQQQEGFPSSRNLMSVSFNAGERLSSTFSLEGEYVIPGSTGYLVDPNHTTATEIAITASFSVDAAAALIGEVLEIEKGTDNININEAGFYYITSATIVLADDPADTDALVFTLDHIDGSPVNDINFAAVASVQLREHAIDTFTITKHDYEILGELPTSLGVGESATLPVRFYPRESTGFDPEESTGELGDLSSVGVEGVAVGTGEPSYHTVRLVIPNTDVYSDGEFGVYLRGYAGNLDFSVQYGMTDTYVPGAPVNDPIPAVPTLATVINTEVDADSNKIINWSNGGGDEAPALVNPAEVKDLYVRITNTSIDGNPPAPKDDGEPEAADRLALVSLDPDQPVLVGSPSGDFTAQLEDPDGNANRTGSTDMNIEIPAESFYQFKVEYSPQGFGVRNGSLILRSNVYANDPFLILLQAPDPAPNG